MAKLRQQTPEVIDGTAAKFTDLSMSTATLAATDGVRFDLADGRRVIVRPSGTEPKLKCYLQAIGDSAEAAKAGLGSLEAAMRAVFN
jgi:phosphomannomutase